MTTATTGLSVAEIAQAVRGTVEGNNHRRRGGGFTEAGRCRPCQIARLTVVSFGRPVWVLLDDVE